MIDIVNQLNLQQNLGGGEIFTRFVARALRQIGIRSRLFVHPQAGYWRNLNLDGVEIVPLLSPSNLQVLAAEPNSVLLTHTLLPVANVRSLSSVTQMVGMLHMPLYERFPEGLPHYRRLWAVSKYVTQSGIDKGLGNIYNQPLLGVADIEPRGEAMPVRARGYYEWDRRKVRDRMLGWVEGVLPGLFQSNADMYRKSDDVLTLAIVSRITPIKQFPAMFEILAPVICEFPKVRLEIFGSGGYASIRDLRMALRPCANQVRFWGQQNDVAAIYRQVDYVISGLPEKEALGLNLLEAQHCGTPVLAVGKPPFTETVIDGITGHFFRDPRDDGGAGFRALLVQLLGAKSRLDPLSAQEHLDQFSHNAFQARLAAALAELDS